MTTKRRVSLILSLQLFVCLLGCGLQDRLTSSPTFSPMPAVTQSPLCSPSPCPINIQPTNTETQAPIATPEKTVEPAPTAISQERLEDIGNLLYGVINMRDGCYFNNPRKLTKRQLSDFMFDELQLVQYKFGEYKEADDHNYVIDEATVQTILKSAFGMRYPFILAGNDGKQLTYRNGQYIYSGTQGSVIVPHILRIQRESGNRILVDLAMIEEWPTDYVYDGKARAVLVEDKESIFGCHLLSMEKIKTDPKFSKAAASSSLTSGKKRYDPAHIIDNNYKTCWAADNRSEEWIIISSNQAQVVSGASIDIGNRYYGIPSNDDPGIPIILEFSDHSRLYYTVYQDEDMTNTVCFDEEINTNYIKIIIPSHSGNVEFYEIDPF